MLKTHHIPNYDGKIINYKIVNEVRKIENVTNEIINPTYGSFFSELLSVFDNKTGLRLVRGVDYKCTQLDTIATKKSGKEVFQKIVILNKNLKEVKYNYTFLGGNHLSGLHLINEAKRIFPNGVVSSFPWDNVVNKPETFKPNEHQMHLMDTYGYDGVSDSVQRMIDGVKRGVEHNTTVMFNLAKDRISALEQHVTNTIDDLKQYLEDSFLALRVQDGEYIFTDSIENPVISRGYGRWVRITNTILKGTNSSSDIVIGEDGNMFLNSYGGQIVRNCFIWKNEETIDFKSYFNLDVEQITGNNVDQFKVGDSVVITLTAYNTTIGSKIAYKLIDINTGKVVSNSRIDGYVLGNFVIGMDGKAKITVKFKPSQNLDEPALAVRVILLNQASTTKVFTVLNAGGKQLRSYFSTDIVGLQPLDKVVEGQEFFYHVVTSGYTVGETIYVDDSLNGSKRTDFDIPYPMFLTVPSSFKIAMQLRVKEDRLTDGNKPLILYVKNTLDEPLTSLTSKATINVLDTSVFNAVGVTFKKNGIITNNVNEGDTVSIVLESVLPNTKLSIQYSSSRLLSNHSNLIAEATTGAVKNSNGHYEITYDVKVKQDFYVNDGVNHLTLNVRDGANLLLGSSTLLVVDNSATPSYQINFKDVQGGDITFVNEGQTFEVHVSVPGWNEQFDYPIIDLQYSFASNTDINAVRTRIDGSFHSKLGFGFNSNGLDNVAWVNGNTLKLTFTAIADNKLLGWGTFGISIKPEEASTYTPGFTSVIMIRDTSVSNVEVVFSSSAVEKLPLESLNEMNVNGGDYLCYLWITVDNDLITLGGFRVTVDKPEQLVSFNPNPIQFDTNRRHIVPVTIKADMIKDGNMEITFFCDTSIGTHNHVRLFAKKMIIIDTSFPDELNVKFSTSATEIITPPNNQFSELATIYAHVTYTPANYLTNIRVKVDSLVGGFWTPATTDFPGVLDTPIPAGVSVTKVIPIVPVNDRQVEGIEEFRVTVSKWRGGTKISLDNSSMIQLLDDSVPLDLTVAVFMDVNRTIPYTGTPVAEGTKLYLTITLVNPPYIEGTSTVLVYAAQTSNRLISSINRGGVISINPNRLGTDITHLEIWTMPDRLTTGDKTHGLRIMVGGMVNPVVGGSYTGAWQGVHHVDTHILIADTSKTPAYAVTAPSTVKEDNVLFSYKLAITNGTVGDVYYVQLTNSFDVGRFGLNQLGLEQLLVLSDDTLVWNFRIPPNYKVDNSYYANLIGMRVINKTTGAIVTGVAQIEVTDTSGVWATSGIYSYRFNEVTGYSTLGNRVDEGKPNQGLVIRIKNANPLDHYMLEWVSGRPMAEVIGFPFDTWIPVVELPVFTNEPTWSQNGPSYGLLVPMFIKADKQYTPSTSQNLELKLTSKINANSNWTNPKIYINDTSLPRGYTHTWKKNGVVATSVNEGEEVTLEIKASGGEDIFPISVVDYHGGLSSNFEYHEFGVVKSAGNNAPVEFKFKPKKDQLVNTGISTSIRVLVNLDGVLAYVPLVAFPINDTSLPIQVTAMGFYTSDGTFLEAEKVTSVNEGVTIKTKATLSQTLVGDVFTLKVSYNTGEVFQTKTETMTTEGVNTLKFDSLTVPRDDMTNIPDRTLVLEIFKGATLLGTSSIPINDTSKSPLSTDTDIRITTVNPPHNKLTSINEGESYRIFLSAKCFEGVKWGTYTVKYVIHAGVDLTADQVKPSVPDTDIQVTINQSDLSPDGTFSKILTTKFDFKIEDPKLAFKLVLIENNVIRVMSDDVTLNDVSPPAIISEVYYSSDVGGLNRISNLENLPDRSDFYIIGKGRYLSVDKSSVVAILNNSTSVQSENVNDKSLKTYKMTKLLPNRLTLHNVVDGDGWGWMGAVKARMRSPVTNVVFKRMDGYGGDVTHINPAHLEVNTINISDNVNLYLKIFNTSQTSRLEFYSNNSGEIAAVNVSGDSTSIFSIRLAEGLSELGATMSTMVGLFAGPTDANVQLDEAIAVMNIWHSILDD